MTLPGKAETDSLTGPAGVSVGVGWPGFEGVGNRKGQMIKVKKSSLPRKTTK